MKILNRNIERTHLINIVIFLIGIAIVLTGIIFSISQEENREFPIILISVGSSIIASSIVAFISLTFISKQTKIKEIIEKWGLIGIYNTRAEMNVQSNKILDRAKHEIDLIVMGMREFRDAKGDLLIDRISKGVKVRIISMHPNSIFVSQREIEENRVEGEIKKTIEDLAKWVEEVKSKVPKPENIKIKYYDGCPQDSYMRIDNNVFIGPNQYKKLSQQTISFEFDKNLLGYLYYANYFERLWNDNDFSNFV